MNMGKRKCCWLLVLIVSLLISAEAVLAAPVLSKTTLTLTAGKSSTLKVTGTSKTVKWSSSDKTVATVNQSGKVVGVFPGKATIKAKIGTKTKSCKVKVVAPNVETATLTFKTKDNGMFIQGVSAATVSFSMKKKAYNVKVRIKNSSGSTILTKTYKKLDAKVKKTLSWDAKGAAAGTYHVEVKAGSTVSKSGNLIIRKQMFAGGNGSSSNPFQVKTFAQFKKIEGFNGCYFIQTADIDCQNATFSGLFTADNPFVGNYNGKGKAIKNLFLSNSQTDNIALFNSIGEKGKILNLKLTKVYVTGTKVAGVLAVNNAGMISKCTFTDCSVSSTISGSDCWSGIIVENNAAGATITGCNVVRGAINASYGWYHGWTGGLVGVNHGNVTDCTIRNSFIKSVSTSYGWTHGAALVANNAGNVVNCVASDCTLEGSSGNCDWNGNLASTNTGYMASCAFVGGSSIYNDFHENNGTFIP